LIDNLNKRNEFGKYSIGESVNINELNNRDIDFAFPSYRSIENNNESKV
jgi:hypothetical protein